MHRLSTLSLVFLGANFLLGQDSPPFVSGPDGKEVAPIMGIDNVTAWPNLTVLPDGSIAAAIFNQPSHGSVEGNVEVWASTDQGKTWAKRGVPCPHLPRENRMNCAAGLAANGDLIVLISGWADHRVEGQEPYSDAPFRAAILDPVVCRSSDGGRTWTQDPKGMPARCPDGGIPIPFGDILPGKDGELLAVGYSGAKKMLGLTGTFDTWIFRSKDDGRTWGEPAQLDASNNRNETAIFHLGGGKWLAAARGADLGLYRSEDDGRSWAFSQAVTQRNQIPAHLMRLKDGRLLLSYGNRTASKGVDVRYSNDEGATWSEPRRLVAFEGDGGYPSSVQLPDGSVLTAYYAQKTSYHGRYHMGVVNWKP